jgi:hypothetical protein
MISYELSYLMRLGAGKHPACTGRLFRCDETDELSLATITATCALGAAIVALASLTTLSLHEAMAEVFNSIRTMERNSIFRWHDGARLSREKIADRLDAFPGGSPVVRVR